MELKSQDIVWSAEQSQLFEDHYWLHVRGTYAGLVTSSSVALYIPEGSSGEYIGERMEQAKPTIIEDLKNKIQRIIDKVK